MIAVQRAHLATSSGVPQHRSAVAAAGDHLGAVRAVRSSLGGQGIGLGEILKQFGKYSKIREIIISENGAAFDDVLNDGRVEDTKRIQFFQDYLASILKAKKEGVKVGGYLAWSLLDNFEWAEGYGPRFGLVYVNYENQERTVKNSGKWFAGFLES